MAELEKVIKGLELCTEITQDGCMMFCPYKDEQDETYSGFCEQVLKRDALKLLKEKQPKKGHWVMRHRHRKSVRYVTGVDKWGEEHEIQFVEESEGDEPYCSECGAAAAESFQNFCPKCGADMRKDGDGE